MSDTENGKAALVTGSAGFVGFHLCRLLLEEGWRVTGLDAMTDYYDVGLKRARHAELGAYPGFAPVEARLEEPGVVAGLMAEGPRVVVHLAAQAGVRYSLQNPASYVASNLDGTFAVLEAARAHPPAHLLMASTSSVYGTGREMPYRETAATDRPLSFYAATKKANEAMAHAYAHLYRIPVTMFRFFTVYGPWGRPDMAPWLFTSAILEGRPIEVFNEGRMERDFTYVGDLVRAVRLLFDAVPGEGEPVEGDTLSPDAPYRIVNIGNGEAVPLTGFIAAVEAATGRAATRNLRPMQKGDVRATWADTGLLHRLTGYRPETGVAEGMAEFVAWFRDYHGV